LYPSDHKKPGFIVESGYDGHRFEKYILGGKSNSYKSNRVLGDEFSYVLDRKT